MGNLFTWEIWNPYLLQTVESTPSTIDSEPILALTYLAILIFSAIHYWSRVLHHHLYKSDKVAVSFGGGMAIAYVFIHLMGELSAGYEIFGSSIHFVSLLGFTLFYGLNRLIARIEIDPISKKDYIFYVEILFYCLYNLLIVYAIPKQFHNSLLLTFLYVISISFHFLHNDYSLAKKHPHKFHGFGRYAAIFFLIIGSLAKIFSPPPSEFVADFLIAILAGIIISNVFTEELPRPENSSFRWFVAGIATYLCLLIGIWIT